MNSFTTIKSRLFPKGVKRSAKNFSNKIFKRTTEKKLVTTFNHLSMEPGSVICIHAMLSEMGYLVGGPEVIFKSLIQAVPDCTIIMPTFPFDDSTDSYLSQNPIYDKDKTPSKSGLLSETFRNFPGVKRSFHPTHPCSAIGPMADFLIDGSEYSETPFGDESSYGRYCALDNAVQLLIHTNNSSIVHRVQELVNIPSLFEPGVRKAKGSNKYGRVEEYAVKVHTPVIPLFWILPGDGGSEVEYLWSPDYSFLLPDYNRNRVLSKLKSSKAKNLLVDRHQYFFDNDIYRSIKIHDALITVVKVKPWLERICSDLFQSLEMYGRYYSRENLSKMLKQGKLSKY
jgi:aminoglycoside N3'-acetyltransferase